VGKAHLRDPEKVFLTGMQLDVSGLELLEDIALHVHDVTLRHRRPLRSRQSRFHTIRCAARAQRGRAVNGFHRRGRVVKIAARGLGRQRFEGPMPDASTALAQKIAQTIAAEIGADAFKVQAAVALLDDGATVPFIARYRKEATGGLDDAQLRTLEQRLAYLRELEDRRKTILASIDEQGKLTPELKAEIEAADTKSRLEDLYLPYRPKRRTKAQIAREAGLEPLADALLGEPDEAPETLAEPFVNADKGVADAKAA